MAHFIDKDALVAEIERLMTPECGYSMNKLIDFIESLEVKEVDLEKEIEEHAYCMPMSEFTHESEAEDFYELVGKEFMQFYSHVFKTQKGE